jgi:hypothetical protein
MWVYVNVPNPLDFFLDIANAPKTALAIGQPSFYFIYKT